jgi:BirA family biotin operon repressor/biotin-[acetyl-CoA-carboxylase] ligase
MKPRLSPEKLQSLSAAAAAGVLEGIQEATGAPLRLKWPNDILLGGKKLAGVIVETSLRGDTLEWAVIGAGINVNNPLPPELLKIATTLSQWQGQDFDLAAILTSVINGFFKVYDQLLSR